MNIVSSHLTRASARKVSKKGQKVIKAGIFANGSFGLYRPGFHTGPVIITVWHIVE